jgi:2-amino-4-hydroxy-6-hydroxymethyldihydropteridine diphosphokinase
MPSLNSFFIATGSNLGDSIENLLEAKDHLRQHFTLIAESKIYKSPAVDYLSQPDFYNQVLELTIPCESPEIVMLLLLDIENKMGRNRIIPRGPRVIDLDILFWGLCRINDKNLQIPHPRLFERSFVVLPLAELPGFAILKNHFNFNFQFNNHAKSLS